jgi:hypothetical protein
VQQEERPEESTTAMRIIFEKRLIFIGIRAKR